MLQASANVDLPSSQFSGGAATWYVFAVRSAGSQTFTLAVNTSAAEATDQRLIGEAMWDGSNVTAVTCYFAEPVSMFAADYDSGWFACAYNNTYTKTHSLGGQPRLVMIFHSSDAAGTSEWVRAEVVSNGSAGIGCWGVTAADVVITAANNSSAGCVYSARRNSGSGYYRILAWK
jgi:hypothetical protein